MSIILYVVIAEFNPKPSEKVVGLICSNFHKTCNFGQNLCTKVLFVKLRKSTPVCQVFDQKMCSCYFNLAVCVTYYLRVLYYKTEVQGAHQDI